MNLSVVTADGAQVVFSPYDEASGVLMYSACLFCHSHLSRNERLPRFPVGRRLAFDTARGRLWVVCPSCGRWNLSPLEERWYAFDECERLFRATRVRVSTENIGLVELPDGVSLIRIGKPLRPEFAAWRYGRRFMRRRVKAGLATGTIVGGAAAAALGAVALGYGALAFLGAYAAGLWIVDEGPKRRPATTIRIGNRFVRLLQDDAEATRVFSDGGPEQYGLALHHQEGVDLLRGAEVRRVLGWVVPTLNPFGGATEEVSGALELIDTAGDADVCVADTLRRASRHGGWFADLPIETRLALEMSLQEAGERRALEQELAALELAWRDAESIAAIADNLLVPDEITDKLKTLHLIRTPRRSLFAAG